MGWARYDYYFNDQVCQTFAKMARDAFQSKKMGDHYIKSESTSG